MSFYTQVLRLEAVDLESESERLLLPESLKAAGYQPSLDFLQSVQARTQAFAEAVSTEPSAVVEAKEETKVEGGGETKADAPPSIVDPLMDHNTGYLSQEGVAQLTQLIAETRDFLKNNRGNSSALLGFLSQNLEEQLRILYANIANLDLHSLMLTGLGDLMRTDGADVRKKLNSVVDRFQQAYQRSLESGRVEDLDQAILALGAVSRFIDRWNQEKSFGMLPQPYEAIAELEIIETALARRAQKASVMQGLGLANTDGIHLKMRFSQGSDPMLSEGGCRGYTHRWAEALLGGEQPFGQEPAHEGQEQPDYAVTPAARSKSVSRYQNAQSSREHEEKSPIQMRRVSRRFLKQGSGIAERMYQLAKDNIGKVYHLNVARLSTHGHALGFRMNPETSQFELFDPNLGWFRFDNKGALKRFFSAEQRHYRKYALYSFAEVVRSADQKKVPWIKRVWRSFVGKLRSFLSGQKYQPGLGFLSAWFHWRAKRRPAPPPLTDNSTNLVVKHPPRFISDSASDAESEAAVSVGGTDYDSDSFSAASTATEAGAVEPEAKLPDDDDRSQGVGTP